MSTVRVTRSYFDARPDSPDAYVEAELPRHAVFRLVPTNMFLELYSPQEVQERATLPSSVQISAQP
jgi:hypothetical protein